MRKYGKNFWRSLPFLRLLIPLVTGIIIERYCNISLQPLIIVACASILLLYIIRLLSSTVRYRLRWATGIFINLLMICTGASLMFTKDIQHRSSWLGNYHQSGNYILVTLQESPIEKTNSFKALATATTIFHNGKWEAVTGNLLVYFKKDSLPNLSYGSQLLIRKTLQPINNSGNPGGFDYKSYCASQDIYFQVYLQSKDYVISRQLGGNRFSKWLIDTRDEVLSILRKYVPGNKEAGVAEALLIGYRNDLDKELVRSYSNTGVVHIIAISGLHLGMIYGLMLWLFKIFRNRKWVKWVRPVVILLVLWGFSLLSGAAASILRSAVMFTFIIIGESLGRKTQVYNTLAASAFCMLAYNPYFLWDVGFQLSYAAVLSIMLFMRPIYRQAYFQNKLLDMIWQLNAITLSAQILTLPVILFYFHQFPNLFLFTNFIAVPLSGFILYGELLLLLVFKIPWLNELTGNIISFLTAQMNGIIERTSRLPYATTDNIQISLTQTFVLYIAIACLSAWLLQKKIKCLVSAVLTMTVFCFLQLIVTMQQTRQQKIVVYNIPKHKAIDIIEGNRYNYIGDTVVEHNYSLQNFHLQPSRLLHGVKNGTLRKTLVVNQVVTTGNSSILLIDGSFQIKDWSRKIPVDLIVISGNPKIYLSRLAELFDCPQYVFDCSNPLWKIRYWKKDAESLHLRHHSVPEQGAFEMAL